MSNALQPNRGGKMKKSEIKKLTRRQEHLVTRLTDDQDEYLVMLEEFYNISQQLKKTTITNDSTRDIAIRCVDSMFEHNLLDSKYYEADDEFVIQDIIHDTINKELNVKEEK